MPLVPEGGCGGLPSPRPDAGPLARSGQLPALVHGTAADPAKNIPLVGRALGFWNGLREVFPETREGRCWFHKTANVLAALPKSAHPGAKKARMAATASARTGFWP